MPPVNAAGQPVQNPEQNNLLNPNNTLVNQLKPHIIDDKQKLKETTLDPGEGIDPLAVIQSYQNCVMNRMNKRRALLEQVCSDPSKLSPNLAMKAKTELLGLKLVGYQRHLRNQMINYMYKVTTLDTGLHLRAYRRPKRFTLRDSRCADRLEQHKRADLINEERKKNAEFINCLQKHFVNFHKFHLEKVILF